MGSQCEEGLWDPCGAPHTLLAAPGAFCLWPEVFSELNSQPLLGSQMPHEARAIRKAQAWVLADSKLRGQH